MCNGANTFVTTVSKQIAFSALCQCYVISSKYKITAISWIAE